jgi:two-component system NtrC family sensor kinase
MKIVNRERTDWRIKVFDSLSHPTLILNPDRTILDANRTFLAKYGVKLEQIAGRKCHEFFYHSQDPCPHETCPLPLVIGDKQGHSLLRQPGREKGEQTWEDRVFSPILDEYGEVEYIIESVRDATQLKILEKELSGIKEFMEKVIQSSASGIVAANRQGKILVMNHAARELFGYSDEAIFSITAEQLYPVGVAREIMKKLRDPRFGDKGKLPSTRVDIIKGNGEMIPVEITAAIIYEDDQEVATMGIFNDLREKLAADKKLEEILKRTARAEKLASLGQLAAGVAHEINNPLTGILLYANLMLERLQVDDPQREELNCVIEDANRCRDIVKSLLVYSRQTSPNKEIFHINNLVDQGLTLIRDQRLFLNVEIIKELPEDMMLIHADRNQLCQVVINLVMNALDAMQRHGTLTLRTYRNKRVGLAYLEVTDTGSGIPRENLSRIFDPFFTTKEPGQGTGLGLSTVHGIVKENGGNIRVKETSPRGTTFVIELPLYNASDDTQLI